ncbi:hypothetical protein [Verrucomicrobium spinosum]|uniref:hypothetical protein n=1 Tax=Verrucomicrobium spinosum TaxID=2736 RepID=UPI000B2C7E5D|nr:hypothetical protein [Verrucomicrobium spinosum]
MKLLPSKRLSRALALLLLPAPLVAAEPAEKNPGKAAILPPAAVHPMYLGTVNAGVKSSDATQMATSPSWLPSGAPWALKAPSAAVCSSLNPTPPTEKAARSRLPGPGLPLPLWRAAHLRAHPQRRPPGRFF